MSKECKTELWRRCKESRIDLKEQYPVQVRTQAQLYWVVESALTAYAKYATRAELRQGFSATDGFWGGVVAQPAVVCAMKKLVSGA